ncbi:MAG: CYTH domain-containing protein [Bacilli bacterium]|nr:CYTH domain-containing protein [Bacilli bacterium]
METEIRYYYSIDSKSDLINYLQEFTELKYQGRFYECTDQYNHPMKKYNFYNKDIDGRFRVRRTIGDITSKCMITWKRRLNNDEIIHNEEEVEVTINLEEYDNLCFLLTNVLHLELVESYERYRSIFSNDDVEIVLDEYPFGLCLEIENKSTSKDAETVIKEWLDKLNLDITKAYKLSWDDKYEELCKNQGKEIHKIVKFNDDMPQVLESFK